MLELGIVLLVNSGLASPPFQGGEFADLPKSAARPNWTYRSISDIPNTTLRSATGLAMARWQIDVYGAIGGDGADAIGLASSIDAILNGYQGTLPDPDSTFVSSCFRSDIEDFFDSISRSPRRMLEYEISYVRL